MTLEGEYLSPGGSMTGGSFRNNSNLLGRNREIEDLQKQLDQLRESIKKREERVSEIETAQALLEQDRSENRTKIQQAALRCNTAQISLQQAKDQKAESENAFRSLSSESEELDRQLAQIAEGRKENARLLGELEEKEKDLEARIKKIMMTIPNIIDPSVPIGKDDSENVEVQKYGEPVVPDFEIPYHTEIMEKFNGIDLDSARRVAGNGFYYLMGDIARLHSAVISYARDFMIGRGFTYCVPPFMIRSDVVTGVMSFAEMDAMMYKIEGEDLYLIGTSEHSMIGKFIDTIIPAGGAPPRPSPAISPCFR